MYERVKIGVRTLREDAKDFHINIGMYQGSASNPFLFTVVIDKLTKCIQDRIMAYVYADDIV